MDFECFRLVLRSVSRSSTKGFGIVHALNITRSSENRSKLETTETCTHDIKKFIALFLSFQGFFLDVSAAKPISVFSLWSFRFDVFLLLEELLFTTVQLISFDISPHCSTLLYSLWLKDAVHQLIKVTPKMTLLSCQSSYIAIAPFQPANHVRVRTTVPAY